MPACCVFEKSYMLLKKSQVNSFLRGNFKNVVSFDQINVQTVQLIHNKRVDLFASKVQFYSWKQGTVFVNDYTAQS